MIDKYYAFFKSPWILQWKFYRFPYNKTSHYVKEMPVLYFEQTLWRRLSSFSVDINPIHFHFKERSANF